MGFVHDIDAAGGLARVTFSGVATEDDLRRCLSRIWTDPLWSSSFSILMDFREVTRLDASQGFLRSMPFVVVGYREEGAPGGRFALLLGADLCASLTDSLLEHGPCRCPDFSLFSDPVEAMEWIQPGAAAGKNLPV
jgi:hypothetical protein